MAIGPRHVNTETLLTPPKSKVRFFGIVVDTPLVHDLARFNLRLPQRDPKTEKMETPILLELTKRYTPPPMGDSKTIQECTVATETVFTIVLDLSTDFLEHDYSQPMDFDARTWAASPTSARFFRMASMK